MSFSHDSFLIMISFNKANVWFLIYVTSKFIFKLYFDTNNYLAYHFKWRLL